MLAEVYDPYIHVQTRISSRFFAKFGALGFSSASLGATMNHHSDLEMKAYYRDRAPIYDRVYFYPERQEDLRFLESYIPQQFVGCSVLEIAAGTGYWTQFIATHANSILATDATKEALDQLQRRNLDNLVSTKIADAYSINEITGKFNGVFSGFWLSHVPKQKLKEFLYSMHQILPSGAIVVFVDNSLAQCVRLPLDYTDEVGNTYQNRELGDGTIHRVLKNFPTEKELLEATSGFGTEHKHMELDNFWLFQYIAN